MIVATLALLAAGQGSTLETVEIKIPGHLPTFKMVKVPAGKITIGDKEHEIKPVWVGETEVTWDVYDIYAYRLDLSQADQAKGVDAAARPSRPYGAPDRGFGHSGYPALGMTSNAAVKFCEWLTKKTGKKFRLLTSAEWEYAARAGATEEPKALAEHAWFWDNAEDQTQPVANRKPNAWGLHDMLGNTWEWISTDENKFVVAGGGYSSKAADLTFGSRKPFDPKWQEADAHVPKSKWWLSDGPHIGMRLACEP